MKILITGANGQVGKELSLLANQVGITTIALDKSMLDISEILQCQQALKAWQPNYVINMAAYTAVDKAEQDQNATLAANFYGPRNLAHACADANVPLIHLSTDYVFDGKKNTAYQETDKAHPLNFYGESKLLGEQSIQNYCSQHIILRVSGVFGLHGHNFVKTILRLAREQETLRIVKDQITCPTSASSIAHLIITLLSQLPHKQNAWGIYHWCSEQPTSWYDFTCAIVENLQQMNVPLKVTSIQPILTSDLNLAATRPHYSVLNCEKIKKEFGMLQPSWNDDMRNLLTQLLVNK